VADKVTGCDVADFHKTFFQITVFPRLSIPPVTQNSLSPYEESISQSTPQASDMVDLLTALQDSKLPAQGEVLAAANVKISTEKRPARERRILASVIIPAPVEKVWQVITDYERLADFVPNVTSSKLLPHPEGQRSVLSKI
jgi:hypothetical protein